MEENKQTILIVVADYELAEMLKAYFEVQGYRVNTASRGEDGIQACLALPPDLLIIDVSLPDLSGFEVASQIRANRTISQFPMIFLTEIRERTDRLRSFDLLTEGFITKPFDFQELRLRVRNALKRNTQGRMTNSITRLPEGPLIDERLSECLDNQNWALLLVTLHNINGFRESHGLVVANDLLRAVAIMMYDALHEIGSPDDFLGHLSLTDFLVVTEPATLPRLKERIQRRLEQSINYFYRDPDRQRPVEFSKRMTFQIRELLPEPNPSNDVEQIKAGLLSH